MATTRSQGQVTLTQGKVSCTAKLCVTFRSLELESQQLQRPLKSLRKNLLENIFEKMPPRSGAKSPCGIFRGPGVGVLTPLGEKMRECISEVSTESVEPVKF